MPILSEQEIEDLHSLCSQSPQQAIKKIRQWESVYAHDENFLHVKPAFLIDAGSTLRDAAIIQEGVEILETQRAEMEKTGEQFSSAQWFNLGNGHYAAESARRGRNGYVYDPTATPMTRAKECYRYALENWEEENDKTLSSSLLASLHTNYGNSLAELGRVVEAIEEYEQALELNAEHPMPWLALGGNLYDFAQFVCDPLYLQRAVEAFEQALLENRLERYGYAHLRAGAIRKHQEAQQRLSKIGGAERGHHVQPAVPGKFEQEFVDFCLQHQLFLNFSLRRVPAAHPYQDIYRFSVITPIGDRSRFVRLARVLNELNERFASARLLLFEAHRMPYDSLFYDTITRYIDSNDASLYGVRAGKLKMAYENAYNILDKIAFFLYEYLETGRTDGIAEKQVSLATLWGANGCLRPAIKDRQNNFLFALFDLARDLGKGSYWEDYKETRHSLTHRYLVLHSLSRDEWHWHDEDGEFYHLDWEQMMAKTIRLLWLTRAAMIYLLCAVELEEARHAHVRQQEQQKPALDNPYYLHPPGFGLT